MAARRVIPGEPPPPGRGGRKSMDHITEAAHEIPVLAEADVVVCGSGPGGLAAALASARAGADTILLERYGCFGGVITQVGVESIAWYRHEGTVDSRGIGTEIEERAKSGGASAKEPQSESQAISAEMFKVVADALVTESGVRPFLHTSVVAPVIEDGRITGVITESKSGRQAIRAARVIDATGDADVAFRAGAPCRETPKRKMLGLSVVFSCTGVNRQEFMEYVERTAPTYADWGEEWTAESGGKERTFFSPYLEEPFRQAREDGVIPPDLMGLSGTWSTITEDGQATGLNLVYMRDHDGTDVRDLTHAEMEGRRRVMFAIEALRRYVPGFENARLRNFGMNSGVRDTRKIIGKYNLTGEDVRGQARFEESVGIFPEFIDGYGILVLPTTGRYFQIPYGAIVPQRIENLLVAGRCIAGDRVAHASTRSMMCCTVTGQAAGVAAAVSLAEGVPPDRVTVKRVQEVLEAQGARIY